MAIKATLETSHGEARELYIRLNNVEVSNHGVQASALFRGFLSKDAFDAGKGYVWELEIRFSATVDEPLWKQAYEALKSLPAEELPAEPEPLPEAPVAPEAPAEDASDVEKQRHARAMSDHEQAGTAYETAKCNHALAVSSWERQSAETEARNARTLSLATGEDA